MSESIAIVGDGSELILGDGSTLILNVEPVAPSAYPFCAFTFIRPYIKSPIKDTFSKSPYEEFFISCELGKIHGLFAADEIIESGEVVAFDVQGINVTESVIFSDSSAYDGAGRVAVKIKGGEINLSVYTIAFRGVTSAGNKFSHDIGMVIL